MQPPRLDRRVVTTHPQYARQGAVYMKDRRDAGPTSPSLQLRWTARAAEVNSGQAFQHALDFKLLVIGENGHRQIGVWVAARSKLSPESALHGKDPLPIRAAVSLAA